MIENTVIYPNLNNAELQNSYGAIGAIDLAKKCSFLESITT